MSEGLGNGFHSFISCIKHQTDLYCLSAVYSIDSTQHRGNVSILNGDVYGPNPGFAISTAAPLSGYVAAQSRVANDDGKGNYVILQGLVAFPADARSIKLQVP